MQIGITERGDGGLEIERVLKALTTKQVDGAIIITKFPHLLRDKQLPSNTVIHCTITGYGGTSLEPGVDHWRKNTIQYWYLVEQYGPERVVLRVDPIIPTQEGLQLALDVLQAQVSRVRFSFLDLYPHVCRRLASAEYAPIKKLYDNQLHAPLHIRQACLQQIQEVVTDLQICGEPGIRCTGCVAHRDIKAMGLIGVPADLKQGHIRPGCNCLVAKTELLTNRHPCAAKCLYCYWKD